MGLEFRGKKVLIRVDFNVPLDNEFSITDDTRIQAALPTINYVLDQGAAVILMSHLGRPLKKLKPDGSIDTEKFTLRHLVPHLSQLLKRPVQFSDQTVGESTMMQAQGLKSGEVLLLENTRFHKAEKQGDEGFAKQLAQLADIYLNDAFGTAHRAHASTTTVAKYFDENAKGFGFLMENELRNAKKVTQNPSRPFVAIIGGAKVSDKILLLEKLLEQVDTLIIGGGMAYTFVKAKGGNIGKSLLEEDKMSLALRLLEKAENTNVKILLPEDSITADDFSNDASIKATDSDRIDADYMGLDIGTKAIETFSEAIKSAKTILWNGPMGVFEMSNFAEGTKAIALAVAEATKGGAFSLVGGGDSVAAVKSMNIADQVSYVSTGGGAMLELLEGKTLPGVAAIKG